MKKLWKTPVPPPQCPRIVIQKHPRRPARAAAPQSGIRRARVCPPMQLVHPEVIVCLTQEIPNRPPPTVINESEKSLPARIPRILAPLAPLDTHGPPPASVFGSASPNSRVGRTSDDGGMPRSVTPCGAAVVPPLLLSASYVERVTKVPLTIVVPLSPVEPSQQVVVSACGPPFPAEMKGGLETALNFAEIYRKAAQVATFSDDSPVCSFSGRLVAKPVRVSVPTCPLVERESGGSKVIAGAGGNKNYSEDLTLASPGLSTAPTLGWTSTIQEAMKGQPELPPLSPVPAPKKPCVPITLEPASLALSNPSAVVVAQEEAPRLKSWIISSAKHALGDFTTKSKEGYSASAEPPPSIMRRALEPICSLQVASEGSSPRRILSASCWSCQWIRNPWYPKQQLGDLGEASEGPVWRDWSIDLETPNAARLSPEEPVWRDSEEDYEEFVERKTSPLRRAVWKANERLQLTAPQMRLRPVGPPSLGGVFPLGARLRRNHELRSGSGMTKGKDNHPPPPSDGVKRSAKLALSRRGKPKVDRMSLVKPSSVVSDPARVSVMTTNAWAGGLGDLGHGNTTKRGGVTLRHKQEGYKGATREVVSDMVPFPRPPSTPRRTRELVQIRRKIPRRQRCQHPVNSRQGKIPEFERQYDRPYRDICLMRDTIVLPSAERSARQAVPPPSDAPAFPGGNASGQRNVPSLVGVRDVGPGRIVSDAVNGKKKQMKASAFGPSGVRHT